MRVVFLDIDGVLVHDKTVGRGRGQRGMWYYTEQIDPQCANRLADICQAAGAKVVLCSAWRRDPLAVSAVAKVLRGSGLRRTDLIGVTGRRDIRQGGRHLPARSYGLQPDHVAIALEILDRTMR